MIYEMKDILGCEFGNLTVKEAIKKDVIGVYAFFKENSFRYDHSVAEAMSQQRAENEKKKRCPYCGRSGVKKPKDEYCPKCTKEKETQQLKISSDMKSLEGKIILKAESKEFLEFKIVFTDGSVLTLKTLGDDMSYLKYTLE